MFKDKRIKRAEEILDVLEENGKTTGGFVSNLIGIGIISIIGISILNEIKKEL